MDHDDTNARAETARGGSPYLNTKQAAFHLNLAHRTLAAMRQSGRGPRCRRHGVTWRYHIDDLDAWSLSVTTGGSHG